MKVADELKNSLLINFLSSFKIALVSLFLLGVLIVVGTIEQSELGLYLAQKKIFDSVFFMLGPIPLPGARLVMWVMFINLLIYMIFKFDYRWKKLGLIISHIGILALFLSSFITFHYSRESIITLKEGEASNISEDYYNWRVFLIKNSAAKRSLEILEDFKLDKLYKFDDFDLKISRYYPNGRVLDTPFAGRVYKKFDIEKDYENNSPLLSLTLLDRLKDASAKPRVFDLDAFDNNLEEFKYKGVNYTVMLKREQYQLPLQIRLIDVVRELHPQSSTPKSFQSDVEILEPGSSLPRPVKISMNKPLRYKDFTFFQASYGVDQSGLELSSFAVVENPGRILPYLATLLATLGLIIHFLFHFFAHLQRPKLIVASIIVGLAFVNCPSAFAAANNGQVAELVRMDLSKFAELTVLDAGRYKPMDSYARSLLLRFSGRSSVKFELDSQPLKLNSLEWMSLMLMDPAQVETAPVFLINNPEIPQAIGIEEKHRRRYAFAELREGIEKINQFADEAFKKKEEARSIVDNEFIRVFSNIHTYIQLVSSFNIFQTRASFDIPDPQLQSYLNLPATGNSIYDMALRASKIEAAIQGTGDKAQRVLKDKMLDTALSLFTWIESYREYLKMFFQEQIVYIVPFRFEAQPLRFVNPWDVFFALNQGVSELNQSNSLAILNKIQAAYDARQQEAFDAGLEELKNISKTALDTSTELEAKTQLEILYNKLAPFAKAQLLYFFALLFAIISFFNQALWVKLAAYASFAFAFLFHLAAVITRIFILERAPVSNLYETFTFVALVIAFVGVILELINVAKIMKARSQKESQLWDDVNNIEPNGILAASISAFMLLLVAAKFAAEGDTMKVLIAVLNSNFWLSTHVIAEMMGYAGVSLAGIFGHIYLIKRLLGDSREKLNSLYITILGTLAFGFLFTFLGTLLGGIWADQSWGRFWGWDPKENGALLIIIWSAITFHARIAGYIKEIGFAIFSILGTMVVMISWFGVNLLGVGLHSYGFTSGIGTNLLIYNLIEIAFIAFTLFRLSFKSKESL